MKIPDYLTYLDSSVSTLVIYKKKPYKDSPSVPLSLCPSLCPSVPLFNLDPLVERLG